MNEATRKLISTALDMDQTVTDKEREAILNATHNVGQEKLLTIKQAAEILCVHEKYIWAMAKKGQLSIVAISNKGRRVRYSDVQAIMDGSFIPPRSYQPTVPHG